MIPGRVGKERTQEKARTPGIPPFVPGNHADGVARRADDLGGEQETDGTVETQGFVLADVEKGDADACDRDGHSTDVVQRMIHLPSGRRRSEGRKGL